MGLKGFGHKLSKGIHNFGKKANSDLKKLGKKGGVLDLAERKFFNTIDTLAPAAALVADGIAPGSGEAVMKANEGAQSLHSSIRRGVGQIQKIKNAGTKADRKLAIVNFGDNIDDVKEKFNNSKSLLRDAKNAVINPAPTPSPNTLL